MNAEDLAFDLESLVDDLRSRRIDRDDAGLKLSVSIRTMASISRRNPFPLASLPRETPTPARGIALVAAKP